MKTYDPLNNYVILMSKKPHQRPKKETVSPPPKVGRSLVTKFLVTSPAERYERATLQFVHDALTHLAIYPKSMLTGIRNVKNY